MKWLLLACLLVGCGSSGGAKAPPPADFTVLSLTFYANTEQGGKVGYYVSVWFHGEKQETNISRDCYARVSVGEVLKADCRK